MDELPFNRDELAAQALAGGGPRGAGGIRHFMPEQHRLFLTQLPYIFVAAIDTAGCPLAALLTGKPGFVQSPDPSTLHIAAVPDVGDPAAEAVHEQGLHEFVGFFEAGVFEGLEVQRAQPACEYFDQAFFQTRRRQIRQGLARDGKHFLLRSDANGLV